MVIKYTNPSPNGRSLIDCPKCGEQKEYHAKNLCYKCYRKNWKRTLIICKECRRKRPHKAFGLCDGCHTRLHHYGIEYTLFCEIKKVCASCGFSKIVDLHHLDGDNKNNSRDNVVGLCPNCHKMVRSYDFFEEIKDKLKEKGFNVEKVHPSNYVHRRDEKKITKTS